MVDDLDAVPYTEPHDTHWSRAFHEIESGALGAALDKLHEAGELHDADLRTLHAVTQGLVRLISDERSRVPAWQRIGQRLMIRIIEEIEFSRTRLASEKIRQHRLDRRDPSKVY